MVTPRPNDENQINGQTFGERRHRVAPPGILDLDTLLTEADNALYEAKRDGKNCVAVQVN